MRIVTPSRPPRPSTESHGPHRHSAVATPWPRRSTSANFAVVLRRGHGVATARLACGSRAARGVHRILDARGVRGDVGPEHCRAGKHHQLGRHQCYGRGAVLLPRGGEPPVNHLSASHCKGLRSLLSMYLDFTPAAPLHRQIKRAALAGPVVQVQDYAGGRGALWRGQP